MAQCRSSACPGCLVTDIRGNEADLVYDTLLVSMPHTVHAGAVPVPPLPHYIYSYRGCYRDVGKDRAFPNKAWNKTQTIYACTSFAMNPPATYQDQKVKDKVPGSYMGVQYGERGTVVGGGGTPALGALAHWHVRFHAVSSPAPSHSSAPPSSPLPLSPCPGPRHVVLVCCGGRRVFSCVCCVTAALARLACVASPPQVRRWPATVSPRTYPETSQACYLVHIVSCRATGNTSRLDSNCRRTDYSYVCAPRTPAAAADGNPRVLNRS